MRKDVLEGHIEPIPDVGREMMELIFSTMNPDPDKRPSTTQILAMPLMQHYTTMFHNIVIRDAKIAPDVKQRVATQWLWPSRCACRAKGALRSASVGRAGCTTLHAEVLYF